MTNGQGKGDETQSLWAILGVVPAAVGGAVVLGCIGGAGGWLLDPCPMAVGDFAKEGALVGITLGAVLGAWFWLLRLGKEK